jgi:hypothetical protein
MWIVLFQRKDWSTECEMTDADRLESKKECQARASKWWSELCVEEEK